MFYGWFQHRAFDRDVLQISSSEWIKATATATIICWIIAVLPFIYISNPEPTFAKPRIENDISANSLLKIASFTGLIFGSGLGLAQWFLLRRRFQLAWIWILTNALCWAIGMNAVYLTATLNDVFAPKPIIVIVCALGGELCGKFVALGTSFALGQIKT